MDSDKKTNIALTIPWTTVLTIVFVILKLTKVIAWSWWWVLSPLWISMAFVVVVFIILFTITIISDKKH